MKIRAKIIFTIDKWQLRMRKENVENLTRIKVMKA